MFHYVYLNKKNNLIDIRLDVSITPYNFHQHMENLGLLNILFIIAWELDIKYIKVNDITIGVGRRDNSSITSTALGKLALGLNTTGSGNTALGQLSMSFNTTGGFNSASGSQSLGANTTGSFNTAFGNQALSSNTTGTYNTAIGFQANVSSGNLTNSTAIGNNALVTASNTIQLGNTSVTDVKTSGTLTAGATSLGNTTVAGTISATSFINSGGGSGFLKADGSVDNSTYLTISSGVAASGSYTPIITFPNTGSGQAANGASNGSINSATYMRIGNVVTVSVGLTLTTSSTGKIYISLPTGASTSLAQSFVGNVRFPSYQESGIVSIISVSPNYIAEATISTASSSKTNTVNISFQYLVQ